jgi:hypothetical protein
LFSSPVALCLSLTVLLSALSTLPPQFPFSH